jgi:cell division protein FtsN
VSNPLKIPGLFRRRRSISRRKAPVRRNDGDNKSPKNGRLILAVIGAFALMLVLLTVNVRLLRSPTADGQRSTSSDPARSEFSYPARANSASPQGKACPDSPGAMGHNQTERDHNSQQLDQIIAPMKAEKESDSRKFMEALQAPKSSVPPEPSSVAKKAEIKKSPEAQAQKSSQPSDKSPKRYTVQVGAFTNPQAAEEQALHWKSLGYKTLLRPAAMPKAGIVYRLYLGNFQSEKEADSLVRDLKAKGVNSFRSVVSN